MWRVPLALVAFAGVVAGTACGKGVLKPRAPIQPSAPITVAPPNAPALLVLNEAIVDAANGHVVAFIEAGDYDEEMALGHGLATHEGPHRFRVGNVFVDALTGAQQKEWPPTFVRETDPGTSLRIQKLVRFESDGRERWKVPLRGDPFPPHPNAIAGVGRVVASVEGAIIALDDTTGREVWRSPGSGYAFATHEQLVYSHECGAPCTETFVVGRRLSDGQEVFRTALPVDAALAEVTGHIVVRVGKIRTDFTTVLDYAGNKLFAVPGELQAMHAVGGDWVIQSNELRAIDASGRTLWQRAGSRTQADIVDVGDVANDVIVATYYSTGTENGTHVARLGAHDGRIVWETDVPGLGIKEQTVSNTHTVYIEPRGDDLFVVSQGSGGTLFDRLAIATGKREVCCEVHESNTYWRADPRRPHGNAGRGSWFACCAAVPVLESPSAPTEAPRPRRP